MAHVLLHRVYASCLHEDSLEHTVNMTFFIILVTPLLACAWDILLDEYNSHSHVRHAAAEEVDECCGFVVWVAGQHRGML